MHHLTAAEKRALGRFNALCDALGNSEPDVIARKYNETSTQYPSHYLSMAEAERKRRLDVMSNTEVYNSVCMSIYQ